MSLVPMLVIWLRIVHSDVTSRRRSATDEVRICAFMSTASAPGADTEVLLAVTVILSEGRFEAALATCWRMNRVVTATRASTRAVTTGERRADRAIDIGAPWVSGGISAVWERSKRLPATPPCSRVTERLLRGASGNIGQIPPKGARGVG